MHASYYAPCAQQKGKMKKITPLLLLASALLPGCRAPSPDVGSHYDAIAHVRTDLIPENLIEAPGPTRELLWLNAIRISKDREEPSFHLEVQYAARSEAGLLDIRPGSSLVITADGTELQFAGSGSLNRRSEKKGLVSEQAIYECTAADISRIANAAKVTVRVVGERGILSRDFGPENFVRFRKFATQFAGG